MSPEEYWDGEGIRFLNEDCSPPSVEQRVKEAFKRGHEVGTAESQAVRTVLEQVARHADATAKDRDEWMTRAMVTQGKEAR